MSTFQLQLQNKAKQIIQLEKINYSKLMLNINIGRTSEWLCEELSKTTPQKAKINWTKLSKTTLHDT